MEWGKLLSVRSRCGRHSAALYAFPVIRSNMELNQIVFLQERKMACMSPSPLMLALLMLQRMHVQYMPSQFQFQFQQSVSPGPSPSNNVKMKLSFHIDPVKISVSCNIPYRGSTAEVTDGSRRGIGKYHRSRRRDTHAESCDLPDFLSAHPWGGAAPEPATGGM